MMYEINKVPFSLTGNRSWKSTVKTLTQEDVFKKNVNPCTQKIQVSFSKALRKKKLIEICKRSPKEVPLEWTP